MEELFLQLEATRDTSSKNHMTVLEIIKKEIEICLLELDNLCSTN